MAAENDQGPLDQRLVAELPGLRAFLRRLASSGGSRGDVEDLVQEVVARALRYRAAFDPTRALGPWLRGTALRTFLDHRAERAPLAMEGEDPEVPRARSRANGAIRRARARALGARARCVAALHARGLVREIARALPRHGEIASASRAPEARGGRSMKRRDAFWEHVNAALVGGAIRCGRAGVPSRRARARAGLARLRVKAYACRGAGASRRSSPRSSSAVGAYGRRAHRARTLRHERAAGTEAHGHEWRARRRSRRERRDRVSFRGDRRERGEPHDHAFRRGALVANS